MGNSQALTKLNHLNALRAFESVSRHHSFTLAAEELGVTTAAVSQLIRSLEHALGVTLFNRQKGRTGQLELSDAGRIALPDIRTGFDYLRSGLTSIQRIGDASQINIAVSPAFASKWLLPRLEYFRKLFPSAEIQIQTNPGIDDFVLNSIDLGIRYGLGEWDNLTSERLMEEQLLLVCAPSYLENHQEEINSKNFTKLTLLHDTSLRGTNVIPEWADLAISNGILLSDTTPSIKINSPDSVLQACIDGQGVALARSVLASQDILSGKLVRLRIIEPIQMDTAYYVVYRSGFEKLPKVKHFCEWLKQQVNLDI
ncbi:LysR substrate-binding domain-containing protein [Pseudomonas sp. NPDC089547]|uniref:LysR substrate-binding domain-containing protein n=1 Tax=Pseudomonas sp. NPDC089547 TaxID=3390652 RepID=UPI003CFE834C